jgi:guanylate kinase
MNQSLALEHIQDFKDILKNYNVSDRAKEVIENLKLVLLIAPTSGGRNTVIRHLLQSGKYYYIVSDTTRPPRMNDGILERNGKEYWFRSEEDILADLEAGEYLEAELLHGQQVSGTSIRELEKAKDQQKIAITDVDIEGIHNILMVKPDTIAIMLIPPSYEIWQRRLASRGQMRPDEQKRRFETANKIFEDGLRQSYYQFVITDDVEQSSAIIADIIAGKNNPHQGRAKGIIEHIQSSLHEKLTNPF